MPDAVETPPVEIRRIMRTGTVWSATGVLAPALGLGPLLASGWRPVELPLVLAAGWWVGAVAAALGLALLIWAACPVLAFPLEQAYRQKVHCIRIGIVLNVAGMAVAGFAVLLAPSG